MQMLQDVSRKKPSPPIVDPTCGSMGVVGSFHPTYNYLPRLPTVDGSSTTWDGEEKKLCSSWDKLYTISGHDF